MVAADTRCSTARASPTQPVDRSPENHGSTTGRPGTGSETTSSASSAAGGRRRVSSSQVTARPTSLSAPPRIEDVSSIRLHHSPRGRLSRSPATSTRMAPEVAADSTIVEESTEPAPIDWLWPSEIGANQTASASTGQVPPTAVTGVSGAEGGAMGESSSTSTPTRSRRVASHVPSRRLSMPVHAAVDVPAAVVPMMRSHAYSPRLIHWRTRSNVRGSVCFSHRNRLGR